MTPFDWLIGAMALGLVIGIFCLWLVDWAEDRRQTRRERQARWAAEAIDKAFREAQAKKGGAR